MDVPESEVIQNWFRDSPFYHEADAPHAARYIGDNLAFIDCRGRIACKLSFGVRLQIQEAAEAALRQPEPPRPPATRIIEVLERGSATCAEISEDLGLDSESVRIYLHHLRRKGRIGARRQMMQRRNQYFLIPIQKNAFGAIAENTGDQADGT